EFWDASEHAPWENLEEATFHDLTEEFWDASEHAPQADLEEATCHDLTEEFWDASEHDCFLEAVSSTDAEENTGSALSP
ncbi:unnamed protein product, partial [Rangifer tarandus platyrhynchus]